MSDRKDVEDMTPDEAFAEMVQEAQKRGRYDPPIHTTKLSQKDWERFQEIVRNAGEPNRALREAAKKYKSIMGH